MNCNDAYILSNLLIDEVLDDSSQQELEEHLSNCSECTKSLNELKLLNSLLTRDEVEIPVDLTDVILNKIPFYIVDKHYKENQKLKFILIFETIVVLFVTILSLPQLMDNIQTISTSINEFMSDSTQLNETAISFGFSTLNYFEQINADYVSSGVYISIIIICIVFNLILVHKLRRKSI